MENETNAPVLAAAKAPVTDIVKALTNKKDLFVAKSAEQETLKSSLKGATQEVAAASSSLYDEFSSRIEAVSGLVGKKTPLGQQILKLRADLLRANRSNGSNGSADEPANITVPSVVPVPDAKAA